MKRVPNYILTKNKKFMEKYKETHIFMFWILRNTIHVYLKGLWNLWEIDSGDYFIFISQCIQIT